MTAATRDDVRARFVEGMGLSAATVNVVSTDGGAGRAGVTVSAMVSVSADGDLPTLLVCIHHLSPAARTIAANGCFCTNVLKDDQIHVSDVFAGRRPPPGEDKFSCARWLAAPSGAPRLQDALVAYDCRVVSGERVGTHHVFIGEVGDVFIAPGGNPLLYARRGYGAAVRLPPAPPNRGRGARFRVGAFHTFGPSLLPPLLRRLQDEIGVFDLELYEGDQRYLTELLGAGEIDVAFLYDFGLGDDWEKRKIADVAPYVLLAADSPLAARDDVSIADLLELPMVLLDAPPSGDYFMSLFDGVGAPTVAYRTRSFEMARGMVAHGLGYTLLGMQPAAAVSYDGKPLAARPLRENVPASALVLCHRRDAGSDIAARFLRHCDAGLAVQH